MHMKKIIFFSLVVLLQIDTFAQISGGQITHKRTNTTATTAAPKKTTLTPKKTTSAAKTHSSGKPRSSGTDSGVGRNTSEMSQAQKDGIIQDLIYNMVGVQGGTFTMGVTPEQGNDADVYENHAHQVTLSPFSIGQYEVTQEEWQVVMGNNPSYFKGSKRPVENVSWNNCQEFIRKLNAMTGKHFRLPTEAEWEYAARGDYSGTFEHGVLTGDDCYFKYANGDTFRGKFRNNSFYYGRYTIAKDRNYFDGYYSNGQPNNGNWYDENGKVIENI